MTAPKALDSDRNSMGWQRVDASATLSATLSPAELFDRIAGGPSIAILDCRKVLRVGLIPRSRVVRRKGEATLEAAIGRVVDDMMWETPPDDQSTAILIGHWPEDDPESDDADVIAVAAAWLRENFGTEQVLGLAGGAKALEVDEQYKFLLGMSDMRAASLPSRLSDRLLFGPVHGALDANSMSALGVTHVVCVTQQTNLALSHFADGNVHLARAGGVLRDTGRTGVRSLLDEALPFILGASEGAEHVVLITADARSGPTAAAALACAALVADGTSAADVTVAAAAARLEQVRPASALHPDALAQLKQCEPWLRAGAPPEAPDLSAGEARDGLDECDASKGAEAVMQRLDSIGLNGGTGTGAGGMVAPGSEADVAVALRAASDRMQAKLLASLPQPDDDDDDDDDGDYAG